MSNYQDPKSALSDKVALSQQRIDGVRANLEDVRGDVECFDALVARVGDLEEALRKCQKLTHCQEQSPSTVRKVGEMVGEIVAEVLGVHR